MISAHFVGIPPADRTRVAQAVMNTIEEGAGRHCLAWQHAEIENGAPLVRVTHYRLEVVVTFA